MQSTGPTQAEERQDKVLPLWRNLDYMLLWGGQVVSSFGSEVSQLAFPLLILALTRSPFLAGLAGALRALPYLLLSLPAGALVDHWDRKRVMIVCDAGRALALGSIPLAYAFGVLTITQLFVVSTIEGALFVFFNIAEIACLPRVVAKSQLSQAMAQNTATEGISILLGPPLSGLLFTLNNALPFVVDACSYLVSVLSLFLIKASFQKEREASSLQIRAAIREGLDWLWKQPLIRYMAFLTGSFNFIFAGYTLIIIVLAQRMHASSFLIGLIFTISGIGGILGSLIAPFCQKHFSFAVVIIGTSWISAFVFPGVLLAPNIVIIGVLSSVFFITGPIYNVVQVSYRSALIPDELQGRVNSVFRLLAFGGQPLGAALIGFLLQSVGADWTLVFCFIFVLFMAIMTTLNKHVRHVQTSA